MIGKVSTAIVRCYWKLLWMRTAFAEPATERPTGPMSGKPPDAVAWIGSTKLTVKRSKISTFIRWCATRGSGYAEIPRCKQIQRIKLAEIGKRLGRKALRQVACVANLTPSLPGIED